jgi:hypothetical protein
MIKKIWYMIVVLGLICILAGPASALSVTMLNASGTVVSETTNNTIMNGEDVTFNISGMTNGTFFQWNVTNHQDMSTFTGASGNTNTSAFGNLNITIPFMIGNAAFTLSEMNTTENTMIVGNYENKTGGSYHELIYNGSSVNGLFSRTNKLDEIVQGNMSTQWAGTPMAGAQYVTNGFTINGTKVEGPENFDMTTSMYSENPATVDVEISADGTIAYNNSFSIIANKTLPSTSSVTGSDPLTGLLTTFWRWISGQ